MLRETSEELLQGYPGDKSKLGYSHEWLGDHDLTLTDPATISDDQIGVITLTIGKDETWKGNPKALTKDIYVERDGIIVKIIMSSFVCFKVNEMGNSIHLPTKYVKYFGIMMIPGLVEESFETRGYKVSKSPELPSKYAEVITTLGVSAQQYEVSKPSELSELYIHHRIFAPRDSKTFKGQAEMHIYNELLDRVHTIS